MYFISKKIMQLNQVNEALSEMSDSQAHWVGMIQPFEGPYL